MDSNKTYVSEREEHEAIIEDETRCCLCGTELEFEHNIDYSTLRIKEVAHCPSCAIKMKTREHSLQ